MRVSQSTLGAVDKCLLSAQYTMDPPEWHKRAGGSERAVGTGYHAGAELLYQARLDGKDDPSLGEMVDKGIEIFDLSQTLDLYDNKPIENFIWTDRVPDDDTAHGLIRQLLTEYMEGKQADGSPIPWPKDWTVVAVEFAKYYPTSTLFTPNGDLEIETKLGADLIVLDPNGWLWLIDHKTSWKAWDRGKHEPRKQNQAPMYVANARKAFPDVKGYRFVFDIMQYPNTKRGPLFERRVSDPKLIHETAIVKKAEDFAFLYDTVHVKAGMDLPANPASSLCNPKWCDFFQGCPYGAALEQ